MKFEAGDTVVFDPDNFNPDFWNALSNADKLRYYGHFYERPDKPKLLVFVCEHSPQIGHCLLMELATGKMLPMCHTNDFRKVEDDEC
jgi:hypothetical protein